MTEIQTQRQRILRHLQSGKPLSPLEALEQHGCMRLAARIHELKRAGYPIRSAQGRTSGGKRYASYFLPTEPVQTSLDDLIQWSQDHGHSLDSSSEHLFDEEGD